jgi:hypothetical protein
MPPIFPVPQRARIDSQSLRRLPLGQAEPPAGRAEALRQRISRRERVVAKKLNDGRKVANKGGGCVAFPARNRCAVDTDLLRNLSLEQPEVQATGADMVA